MRRTSTCFFLLGFVGVAAFIGCAEGTEAGILGVADLATLPVEAGDENSVSLPPSTRPTTEEDAGPIVEEDAGGGGDPDSGAVIPDAGTDSGGGGGGGGTCASPNACSGATDLGTISGDTGAGIKTAQGSGSQWFTVRVTEDDSNIFGLSLLAKAELTSPPGTNFDLFVYVAGGASGQECSSVKTSSTSTGSSDSTTAEFGESSGGISNGSSDSRTVTVEVRWVSGTCAPAAPWSLTVRGNTP